MSKKTIIDAFEKECREKGIPVFKHTKQFITVDGKLTNIERGSVQHAEIDITHRMRPDGSYFK